MQGSYHPRRHPSGGVAQVSYSADNRKIVKFVRRSVHLAHQSEVEGRPIFEGRDFVRIQDPGDPLMIIDREVNRDDPYRWPRHWEMYQAGLEQEAVGTPVATLFPANPETVDMLRALKITTAEQLAGLSEQGIAKLGMGGRKHVQKAKDFLEAAAGMAAAHGALQMQIDAKDDKLRVGEAPGGPWRAWCAIRSAAGRAVRRSSIREDDK
jgi:hypothetical protein